AGSEAGQPLVAPRTRRGNQAVLDKGEVRTQRLGNICIHGRQLDEQLEELRQRSTSATVRVRYACGSEPGSGQIRNRLIRQFAGAVAFGGAGCDLFEERGETGFELAQSITSSKYGHLLFLSVVLV